MVVLIWQIASDPVLAALVLVGLLPVIGILLSMVLYLRAENRRDD